MIQPRRQQSIDFVCRIANVAICRRLDQEEALTKINQEPVLDSPLLRPLSLKLAAEVGITLARLPWRAGTKSDISTE